MSATIAEDIRKFLQSVMRLEKASQKPILELLEKHFNNFKQELAQMQHGDDVPVTEELPSSETKKGKTSAKKRKRDLRREKMIFHELLLPPVSRRKKGES